MANVEDFIARLSADNPGLDNLIFQIASLVSTHPPPFIYVNDPTTSRITSDVVNTVLSNFSDPHSELAPHQQTRYAHVNAVACFTPRLFYDTVLNSLANWHVNWDDGCENWAPEGEKPARNESLDSFIHGLKALHASLVKSHLDSGSTSKNSEEAPVKMVISITRAERLKESMPELIVPLTRLAELSQVEISVIFISEVAWEDIRPSLGASPEPYYIDIQVMDQQATIQRLISSFDVLTKLSKNPVYHPALRPLYEHFAAVLYSTCGTFTRDPDELAYISAARWPGFVQPLLDEHQRSFRDFRNNDGDSNWNLTPPTEDVRMRLTRLFTPSLTAALEALYPRIATASEWAKDNRPEQHLLADTSSGRVASTIRISDGDDSKMGLLPRLSKFILVAAFLASTNVARTDLRMFGRGLDERKKVRRRAVTKTTGPAKVSPRLMGPTHFPLDRLIAILGVLLEEYDADTRPPAPEFTIPGEYTDMEISRVYVYTSVIELTSIRLLHRISPSDKLDGPPTFKCNVSYDMALALSRQLDVPLNDLLA